MSFKSSIITAFLLVCLQSWLPFESATSLSILAAPSEDRALEEKQRADMDKAVPSDSVNTPALINDNMLYDEDDDDGNDRGIEKRRLRGNKRRLRGNKRQEQKRRLRFHGDNDFENGYFKEKRRLRFHGEDSFGNERREEKRRLRFYGGDSFGNERREEKRRLRFHGGDGFDTEGFNRSIRDTRLRVHHLRKREASSAPAETQNMENVDRQSDFLRNKRSVSIDELAGALKSKRQLSISNDLQVLAGLIGEVERKKMKERQELRNKLRDLGKRTSSTMTEGIVDDKHGFVSLLERVLRDQK